MATTVSLKNALLIVGVLMSAQSSSAAAEQWSSINLLDENLARCLNIPPGAARRSIVSRLCVDSARTIYRVVVSDKRPEAEQKQSSSADTFNPNGAGVECYYIIPPNNNIYHTLCFNRWSGRYLLTTGPSPRPGKKLPLLPLPVVNNGNNTSSSGNNNCQDVKLNGVTIQGLCR